MKKFLNSIYKLLFNLHKPYYYPFLQSYYYQFVYKRYNSIVKKLKYNTKIRVAFFVIHESVWKYKDVYSLLEKDIRFEPVIVICPYIMYGKENMHRDMEHAYNYFFKNGYNVIKTYQDETNKWLNVKKKIKPDIVFFTNPHKLTKNQYYITNYLDCLTCYVPYAFVVIHLLDSHYNQIFHNLLWKAFYETQLHKNFANQLSVNKGINVTVTGYPGIDKLIDKNYFPDDPWKIKDLNVKRIIWAPHHTIEEGINSGDRLDYSNFIRYSEFMIELAERYKDKIQITFKPHPILKPKLYNENIWGKVKTDKYYNDWNNLSNGQLNESDYLDLFLTSDAMIHDSASFMVEYLYTGKPVVFTIRDENIEDRFNEFGKIVYKQLYHAKNEEEIINFINTVIFSGEDYMKINRTEFVNNVLLPPNGRTASENIYNEILKELS